MQHIFTQFGGRGISSFRKRFNQSILRLTALYSVVLLSILCISGFVSYAVFSRRVVHRFGAGPAFVRIVDSAHPFGGPSPEDVQQDLIESFVLVNISLIVLAVILSYWLAKKTLDPIKKTYEAQEQFLGDVSHELRTPLAVLQLALETEGTTAAKSNLEEVKRMTSLVSDILVLSRTDKQSFSKEKILIYDQLQYIAQRLDPLAKEKNVSIIIETAPSDTVLYTNSDLFIRAVTNIIQNGIFYNKPQGTVFVSYGEDGKYMYVKIVDTGIGIAKTEIKNLFERFYRVDKSRARHTGGSGLGLSIVQTIMHRLGGSVVLESVLGKGTTVILTFLK